MMYISDSSQLDVSLLFNSVVNTDMKNEEESTQQLDCFSLVATNKWYFYF